MFKFIISTTILIFSKTCGASLHSPWHEIVVGGESQTPGHYTINKYQKTRPNLLFDVMFGDANKLSESLANDRVQDVSRLIYERVGYGINKIGGRYSLCKANIFESLLQCVKPGGKIEYRSYSRSCNIDRINAELECSFAEIFGFKPEFENKPEGKLLIKDDDQKFLFNLSATINNYLKDNYFKETVDIKKGSEAEKLENILKGIYSSPTYPKEFVFSKEYTPKGMLKEIFDNLKKISDSNFLDMNKIKRSHLKSTFEYFNKHPNLENIKVKLIAYDPLFFSYSITAKKK